MMGAHSFVYVLAEVAVVTKHLEVRGIVVSFQPNVKIISTLLSYFPSVFISIVVWMVYGKKGLVGFSAAGALASVGI